MAVEKPLDKNQYPVMIKTLINLGIEKFSPPW